MARDADLHVGMEVNYYHVNHSRLIRCRIQAIHETLSGHFKYTLKRSADADRGAKLYSEVRSKYIRLLRDE